MQETFKYRGPKRSKNMSAEHEPIIPTAPKLVAIDPNANGFLSEMEIVLKMTSPGDDQAFHHLSLLANLQASIKSQT